MAGLKWSGALCLVLLLAFLASPLAAAPDYAGSGTCASCHEEIHKAWRSSHHAAAWALPSESTVDGDFDDAVFEHRGRKTRFFRRDGGYCIETTDFTGGPKVFEITGVGGIAPLQQYLVETEPGRLQSLDIVWDQDKRTWYHLYPDQVLPPEDGYHWSGPYKTWNARCAECHATGFEKTYNASERTYQSTQAEIGVSCEACHGPGEQHLRLQHLRLTQDDTSQPSSTFPASHFPAGPFPANTDTGFALTFSEADPEIEIQQCAGCHARREPFEDGNPLPGTPFHDAYRLALLRDGLYHADGQILDEVYVYGSFLQSKMYAKGVRCSDCHDPHSARLKATGNALCTQCHSEAGNARFPSLALKTYDDPAHHFHQSETAGGQCVSCHMIERVYMGIDGRRDHSFRVPRPDLTVDLGTPNACTDCHSGQSASWAADAVAAWFAGSDLRGPHFAQVFTKARQTPDAGGKELLEIALHPDFAPIIRASALDLLKSRATPDQVQSALELMTTGSPLIRAAAVSLLSRLPSRQRFTAAEPALTDPSRSVRIAAARQILGALPPRATADARSAAGRASREWQGSLRAKLDFPEIHMALGGTAMALRNPAAALRAFEEVTRLDPQMVDAWILQVRLHADAGDLASAQTTLQKARAANPRTTALDGLEKTLSAK